MREVEAPRDQRDERRARGVGEAGGLAVADVGDPDAARVEAEGLRSDDVARDPAVAALPDLAEAVDEIVVADVVPAVRLHVVGVDRAEDRGHLARGVVVRRVGVVHEDHVHRGRVERVRPAHALVGAPLGAGVDDRGALATSAGASATWRRRARDCRRRRSRADRGSARSARSCTIRADAGPDRLCDGDAAARAHVLAGGERAPGRPRRLRPVRVRIADRARAAPARARRGRRRTARGPAPRS